MRSFKNVNTLFIDFDGTLIDVSERYYAVYKNILGKYIVKDVFSKREYWSKRRAGMSFTELLRQVHKISDVNSLEKQYLSLIEDRRYLCLDKEFKSVKKTLNQFKQSYYLVLVSLRHSLENLCWQLRNLELTRLFDEILTAPAGNSGVKTKCRLIENSKFFKVKRKCMIGDTEIDIESGRKAGCFTAAVISGMRNREYLSGFSPDYIINDISELQNVV